MTAPDREPTVEQFAALASQCTAREWDRLVCSGPFLARAFISIEEAEKAASKFLGRKISATVETVKPSENESL